MLTEMRHQAILEMVRMKKTVSVQELTEKFGISESTARRDLTQLDAQGLIRKIFGGATEINTGITIQDQSIQEKTAQHYEQKLLIAKSAAKLVKPGDFVYIDAGTTTLLFAQELQEHGAVYVTNSLIHAQVLSGNGFRTIILGGEVKSVTQAIVGSEAMNNLQKYNFTKGFFGTNALNIEKGLTTPDLTEGDLKEAAISHCNLAYILCDSSKFEQEAAITFAKIEDTIVLTDKILSKKYRKYKNIQEVE